MFDEYILTALLIFAFVFAITVIVERKLIPVLKSHKMGQKILEIGPRWHKSKEGTPIMGGLAFIFATLVVMAVAFVFALRTGKNNLLIPLALSYGMAVLNGAIGYVDDYRKLIKKDNEGLKAIEKIILQAFIAAIYIVAMIKTNSISTILVVPFFGLSVDLGWFYYVIVGVYILGMVNSANLTDGVDGLLSTVSGVISIFLIVMSFVMKDMGVLMLSAALLGSVCGFLVYNLNPARIFMGDTGSLFIGGIVAGAAIMSNQLILVLIVSIIFVIEAASVIMQRLSVKITRKLYGRGNERRIFKMTPIHHHFEMCKWTENTIVAVFGAITLVFGIVAFFGI